MTPNILDTNAPLEASQDFVFGSLSDEIQRRIVARMTRATRFIFGLTNKSNYIFYSNPKVSKFEIIAEAAEAANFAVLAARAKEGNELLANFFVVEGALKSGKFSVLQYLRHILKIEFVFLKDGGYPEGNTIDIKAVMQFAIKYGHFDFAKKILLANDKLFDGKFYFDLLEASVESGDIAAFDFIMEGAIKKKAPKAPKSAKNPDDYDPVKRSLAHSCSRGIPTMFAHISNLHPEEIQDTKDLCRFLPELFRQGDSEIVKTLINRAKDLVWDDSFWFLVGRGGNVDTLKFLLEKKSMKPRPDLLEGVVSCDRIEALSYLLECVPKFVEKEKLLDIAALYSSSSCFEYLHSYGLDVSEAHFSSALKSFPAKRPELIKYLLKNNCPKVESEIIGLALSHAPDYSLFSYLTKSGIIPKTPETYSTAVKSLPKDKLDANAEKLFLGVLAKLGVKKA